VLPEKSPRDPLKRLLERSPGSPCMFGALGAHAGGRGGVLFRGGPPQLQFAGDPPLSREERLSREEELDKELAECVHLHEEEAAAQFPLRLPPMPSPPTPQTALFDFMAYGLVDSDAFQQLQ
jgi:hypothetical protein